MWSRTWLIAGRTRNAFFYDRAAKLERLDKEIAALKAKDEKESNDSNKEDQNDDSDMLNNNLFVTIKKKEKKVIHDVMNKQSDRIMQNILNASKLLEGRFTFDQLVELDIPNFENIVNNEFANIDNSYESFTKNGTINAYTKNEVMNMDNKVLQEFNRKTTIKTP